MKQHLKQISEATEEGHHAVIRMDGSGWHTNDIADEFANLSMLKLPSYSPELNPIEQVWQWLYKMSWLIGILVVMKILLTHAVMLGIVLLRMLNE